MCIFNNGNLTLNNNQEKKMRKSILVLLSIMLLITIVSCTSSNVKKVRDGHLDAFGNEVTIGEVFDVVSGNTTNWEEEGLDNSNLVIVYAKWDGAGGEVLVQFFTDKTDEEFSLSGGTIGGQAFEVWDLISGLKSEYNKRTN